MPTGDPRWAALVLLAISLAHLALQPTAYAPHSVNQYIYEYQQSQLDASTLQRPYRVGIQVGHYQNENLPEELASIEGNTGAAGGGRTEVEMNLEVSNRVADLLRSQGVLVDILPATVPTGYSADAFVAMHADGSTSSSVRGFKISTRWSSKVATQDAMLVEMLTDAYRAATGLPEDSNVTRNMRGYYAYSPRRTSYRTSTFTPAAIVEMGFMTNAADREVMFKATGKVAAGVAAGIMNFLHGAYGKETGARSYGYGIVDDIALNPTPAQTPRPGGFSGVVIGDWKVLPLGAPSIRVYAGPDGGLVIATLPRGHFLYATLRDGDYYRITLPDGREGWVQRNAVIVQM
ncbi:MAG TPA: N-acetylmuramoyl-L-alanine amidase [Chloroflexia bacterium]|nr:N-acetylmuramoyl-L-alanine amidase [Chloroflexia bacterium]